MYFLLAVILCAMPFIRPLMAIRTRLQQSVASLTETLIIELNLYEVVLNAASSHYAGTYAGPLNAYRDVLEAAGERVLKKYLYYPVSGERVQIG